MYKTIIVALDGSRHADAALMLAVDLAARHGARLVLLHVILRHTDPEDLQRLAHHEGLSPAIERELAELEPFVRARAAPAAAYVPPVPVPENILERIGAAIVAHGEETAHAAGVADVVSTVEKGDPAKRIMACAERERADAIVMGHRGLGYVSELLLGSVSRKVGHFASCACITVKAAPATPA